MFGIPPLSTVGSLIYTDISNHRQQYPTSTLLMMVVDNALRFYWFFLNINIISEKLSYIGGIFNSSL